MLGDRSDRRKLPVPSGLYAVWVGALLVIWAVVRTGR
jgi:hypothetical protein